MTLTNEECVRQYAAAAAAADFEAQARLRHPDWRVDWPQSGERVESSEHFASVMRNHPGGPPKSRVTRIVGAEDRWVVTPGNTVLKVAGSGDFWTSQWILDYPDGSMWHVIDLMELRDGLVWRETVYWAAPFEAAAWRAPWVQRIGPPPG